MRQITPNELAGLGLDATILDVREPDEYGDVRVDGAVNIPLSTLPDRLGEIPRDRDVFVICLSGGRSAGATVYLAGEGIRAVDVQGGITAWYRAGLPVARGRAA